MHESNFIPFKFQVEVTYVLYVQLQNERKNNEASDVATDKFITW